MMCIYVVIYWKGRGPRGNSFNRDTYVLSRTHTHIYSLKLFFFPGVETS